MPSRAQALVTRLVDHPVAVSFVVALLARLAVAIVVSVVRHGSLFLDDAAYFRLAQAAADGRLDSLSLKVQRLYDNTGTLLVPITWLYEVLGPSKLVGQCFVAVLGATVAALTARLALEVVGPRWALIAGLVVALLPS